MSDGDFDAVRDVVADSIVESTKRVARLCGQISDLTIERDAQDRRILELSATLHTYDAIAGDGVRADGKALRKRIEALEAFVNNGEHLRTCASHKVKHRHNHFCGGGPIYHDCDCGYADLMPEVK